MMREIVLDTETTGLRPYEGHKIVEIGCVELINHVPTGNTFHCYINPKRSVPQEAYNVHGLSTEFLSSFETFDVVAEEFLDFIKLDPLIIHNAPFDLGFLNFELKVVEREILHHHKVIDTLKMARQMFPGSPASLDALCKRFKIDTTARTKHGAIIDCELLAEVYLDLIGGRQAGLALSKEKTITQEEGSSKKTLREPRAFPTNKEELEAHKAFMEKHILPNG